MLSVQRSRARFCLSNSACSSRNRRRWAFCSSSASSTSEKSRCSARLNACPFVPHRAQLKVISPGETCHARKTGFFALCVVAHTGHGASKCVPTRSPVMALSVANSRRGRSWRKIGGDLYPGVSAATQTLPATRRAATRRVSSSRATRLRCLPLAGGNSAFNVRLEFATSPASKLRADLYPL